ncbi:MAG: sugar ABC transporter permease [Actinobacteria bacterium]|nr:MAG: sugar ABC transporter permease [Actinomycetota bacterium]
MAQASIPEKVPYRARRRTARDILAEMRREWTAYLFNAPGLVLFAVFTVYAVSVAFWLSFQDWDSIKNAGTPVGFDNYRAVLHDTAWWAAMGHTAYFTFGAMLPAMAIGLGLASLLNTKIRGLGLFRTAFYLPAITPLVIATLLWKWVYNGDYGLANYYLLKFHLISQPLQFLSSEKLAMPAIIVMQIWLNVGFNMVVYLAGLQSIPAELYEAAEVDGASAWQRLRRITFPLLLPTTIFLLVFQTILGMQTFDQIFVMTNGGPPGPGGATTTVTYYIWLNAFRYFKMGYASALAWTLFAVIFVVSLTQFRWYLKRVER